MRVGDAYGSKRFGLSFELFPPKTAAGESELYRNVGDLLEFRPDFITCTYGAGGSTRDKTLDIVTRIRAEHGVSVASHLTCVGATVDDLRAYLTEAGKRGIENIVALRGDPPRGSHEFKPVEGGLSYASELVSLVRSEFSEFGVAVAGYPETHLEAASPEADLENLRRKVDLGGHVVITQLFYANEDYLRFRRRCEEAGIRAPIVPGLLPITNLAQVQRITALCGAKLPQELVAALEACGGDEARQFDVGVEFAAGQLAELIEHDVPGVHFYVLNKSQATRRILSVVGLPR